MSEYISGEHLTDDDVAAHDRGELVEWRRGIDGTMWYRRVPAPDPHTSFGTIRGVPGEPEVAGDDTWPGADYPQDDFPLDGQPDDADHPQAGYPAIRSAEDTQAKLDDYERASLEQWADDLRRDAGAGDDAVGDHNDDA